MSDRDDKKKPKKDYDLGYGKPPKETQFKEGESGNKAGRPKGAKNRKPPSEGSLAKMLREEGMRQVDIKDGGENRSIAINRAIARKVNYMALNNSIPAARLSLDLAKTAEGELNERLRDIIANVCTYREHWFATQLPRIKKIDPIDLRLPHPDNIEINETDNLIAIHGPETREDFVCTLLRIDARAEMESTIISIELQGFNEPDTVIIFTDLLSRFKADHPAELVYWDLFGPARLKEYLDWHFYYGEMPTRWTPDFFEKGVSTYISQCHTDNCSAFRVFMREKLKELMGIAWYDRLEPGNIVVRDEEYDRMRYTYEMGSFYPEDYDLSDELLTKLSDDATLQEYMKWD